MTNILPLPVKKNKYGERVADISTTKYYRQIAEEVLEAHTNAANRNTVELLRKIGACNSSNSCKDFIDEIVEAEKTAEAEELVDVITTCITRLEIIGYDENKRQIMYETVNEKNRKRGYFEDD